jgi:hypothetical protein
MFKFAEIGTDLNNLGITEATLIRFSRRFESRIKPMRDNLTQELRASNDPNTTMRAWIEVNLLAPLINKFTSLDVEDQFIPNANSIRTMQLQHITREQVAANKRERAIMWVRILSGDYRNFPEFSYTMLRAVADRFDKKTSAAADAPDNGVVASVLTHFFDTADQSIQKSDGDSSGETDSDQRAELAEASREVTQAVSAVKEWEAQKPQADQVSAEGMNTWRQRMRELQLAADMAKRRDKLLGAKYSLFGQDLYDLYVVETADKKSRDEQQEEVIKRIAVRWKRIPQLGETNQEFPNEKSKTDYLAQVFMNGRVCIRESWGYETYAKSGPIWVFLDDAGTRGLAAIAISGNSANHMQNRDNSEPQEYLDEIVAFMKNHPEYGYDNPETLIGQRRISIKQWVEELLLANSFLDEPSKCVDVAFSAHPKSSIAIAKVVNWQEPQWNRYVKNWLVNKLSGNDQDVQSGLSAILKLLTNGQKTYQAFKNIIDMLGDLIDRKLPIIPTYLEYVRVKGERRHEFEKKMKMNAFNRASVLAAQARAFNGVNPQIKEEILKYKGVFEEYMYLPDAPPLRGDELVEFIGSFRGNPQRALDAILKTHRAGEAPSGIAPILIPYLKLDPHAAATWAVYILQGRFQAGEYAISKDKGATAQYAAMLLHRFASQALRMRLPEPIMDAIKSISEHQYNREEAVHVK